MFDSNFDHYFKAALILYFKCSFLSPNVKLTTGFITDDTPCVAVCLKYTLQQYYTWTSPLNYTQMKLDKIEPPT